MPTPRTWPAILVPRDEEWTPNTATSVSSGRGFANNEQPVVGPTGYVSATLVVPCKTPATVLAMRGLIAGLDGRAGRVIVGPNETARAPWVRDPYTGGAITYQRGAADAARDPGYAGNSELKSTLDFRLAAAAALNATSLSVNVVRGSPILSGHVFSIGTGLHCVIDATPGAAGAPTAITIRPWLRTACATGTALEFGRPLALMRAARDDTGRMNLELARFGEVVVELVEAEPD